MYTSKPVYTLFYMLYALPYCLICIILFNLPNNFRLVLLWRPEIDTIIISIF